ncbi:PepSY domain-containing protein [Aegicerativicinus sediminis]|uniref:PepSY domain-containing protein n=1 Tax=Aegicerativicinus sediminis TaxID=2893202 RepID=UPI001E57750E|nr:PepSY domain-containing protein [Aegicerativicinus sediminis]
MIKRKTQKKFRKVHRYLGLFLGIQFLFWTISGLYFSWTNIDEIHGDQFKKLPPPMEHFTELISPTEIHNSSGIHSLELRDIAGKPYYWINNSELVDAKTGISQKGISKLEALDVAKKHLLDELQVKDIKLITEIDKHHEYREKLLPAYVITYKQDNNLKAYVSYADGKFQTVRHRAWRWFDFLWMTHTMDYESRDNFNTVVLRAFSLLGLITVLSGFALFYVSSPTIQKLTPKNLRS